MPIDSERDHINDEKLKQLLAKKSIEELVVSADSIGAQLSLQCSEWADGYVIVRDEDACNAIEPMIQSAKNYLYAKDFNDDEIQEMLTENNAQEHDLIPLVMTLIEKDEDYNFAMNKGTSFSFFTQSAYASELTVSKALSCAIDAVLDARDIYDFMNSISGKVITKAAVKAAFKIVLKRTCGAVAVALAAYEFYVCIND